MTLVMIGLYLVQFIIFPEVFPKYYPRSNEATAVFLIPTVLSAVLGIWCFKVKFTGCLIADSVYCAMICIYNGHGHYGIGLRGIFLDGAKPVYSFGYALVSIMIIFILLVIFQALIYGLYGLFLKIKTK